MKTAVQLVHYLLKEYLPGAKCILDGTAGNGHDTLFLAKHSPDDAVIWTFDIQELALTNTRKLLTVHALENKIRYILDNHANVKRHIPASLDLAVFNLGYLPGGCHMITTCTDTTLKAVAEVLSLLRTGGVVSIIAYPGHAAGKEEQTALETFLSELPQEKFSVGSWQMLNQVNSPPVVYIIEKVRGVCIERTTTCQD